MNSAIIGKISYIWIFPALRDPNLLFCMDSEWLYCLEPHMPEADMRGPDASVMVLPVSAWLQFWLRAEDQDPDGGELTI